MKIPAPIIFIAIMVAVTALWAAWGVFAYCQFGGVTNAGVFGDMFGGFSALMSAIGFAGVATTLYLQIRELEESRDDRKKSDERHNEQIRILAAQFAAMQAAAERDAEPRFEFKWSGAAGARTVYIHNTGAPIKELSLTGDQRITLHNAIEVESGNPAHFVVNPALQTKEKVIFALGYVTRAGQKKSQRFALEYFQLPRHARDGE